MSGVNQQFRQIVLTSDIRLIYSRHMVIEREDVMAMPRKVRTHVGIGDMPSSGLTPNHLTKQEFAKRVYNLMLNKGWHQSELARQAGLTRDSISTYINGKVFPTPSKLGKLAKAL